MNCSTCRRLIGLCRTWCGLFLLLAGPATAQTFFAEESEKIGRAGGRSTSFGDYDNDGWPDLFFSDGGTMALLHNEAGEGFTGRAATIQTDRPFTAFGGGSIFGDYDNDGDLDLYVPVGLFNTDWTDLNLLLRNDRGVFRDVTLEAGLTDEQPTDNAVWLDYDGDGNLDLFTGNLGAPATRDKLFRNQGDGTFADVTAEAGLDVQMTEDGGGSNGGMVAGDFDDDGWPDLYIGVFGSRNRLFLNDGQGSFRDATTDALGDAGQAFGVAVGDVDNDGDLDICQAVGGGDQHGFVLLRNLGDGQFSDETEGAGLAALKERTHLGVGLADIDNDGDLDLLTSLFADLSGSLFLNEGDGTFVDASSQSGISQGLITVSSGDYDLDGFLDVLFGRGGPNDAGTLYRNNGNDNHWLRVELVGSESNRNGVGARLVATSGDLRQMREIRGGRGYDQDEPVAHFGLGQRTQVDELAIRWPSGEEDVLTGIPSDQKIRVIEGRDRYHAVHPTVWVTAQPGSLVVARRAELKAVIQPALFEADAQITAVTANLSALGGSAEVPLVDQGDGSFSLQRSLTPGEATGIRVISVLVEQQGSLGPYWTNLSRSIVVLPAEDLLIFDEVLSENWQVEGNRNVETVDLTQTRVVFVGSRASAFQVKKSFAGWTVSHKSSEPVAPFGFSLRFAFRPGDLDLPTSPRFSVTLPPGDGVNLLKEDRVDLARQEWQVIDLAVAPQEPTTSINLSGNFGGTFYLDDLRLVTAAPPPITAVLEEHLATVPQAFTLFQNYPNPFNPETTIRFDLPRSAEIELSLFNLTGQKVATLAQGRRDAGTYALRWDGRDDDGDERASGVYLYRLQAGSQTETRKLLLLR